MNELLQIPRISFGSSPKYPIVSKEQLISTFSTEHHRIFRLHLTGHLVKENLVRDSRRFSMVADHILVNGHKLITLNKNLMTLRVKTPSPNACLLELIMIIKPNNTCERFASQPNINRGRSPVCRLLQYLHFPVDRPLRRLLHFGYGSQQ